MKEQTTAIDTKKQKAAPPSESMMDMIVFDTKQKMKKQMDMIVFDHMQKMKEMMDMMVFDTKQKMAEQMYMIVFDKMAEQMDMIVFDTKQKMAEQMDMIVFDTKKKMAVPSEPPLKDADFPDLYVQLVDAFSRKNISTWHSLDLKLGKPAMMDWESDYYCNSVALSLKSDIFLLGGYHFPSPYHGHVHRFDTAKAPSNSKFTFLTSIPTTPSKGCNCAALSDKIYVFHILNTKKYDSGLHFKQDNGENVLEVYDPSSNEWRLWRGFSEAGLNLPNELKGIDPSLPVLSDSLNNRILAHYPSQGVYAFYPDTFKWELLSSKRFDFQYSAVINGVLYHSPGGGDIRWAVKAFDLEDNLQPLRMVWPRQNRKTYLFDYPDVTWMTPIDLGNGRVCLLHEITEDVNPAHRTKSYLYSYSDSDPEHFYCSSSEDDVAPPDETKYDESKYMLVLKGMILEVEKKAGSKGNMKLWVNKAIRVRYEFDYFPWSRFRVRNIVTVARP